MKPHSSRLARYSLAVYWLLVVYGSLYPFSGWRDSGAFALEFLSQRYSRWYTFDVVWNIAAYFPLGFLAAIAVTPRMRGLGAFVPIGLAAGATSIMLESLQNYLPGRIPSNIDVVANVVGALAGALAGRAAWHWLVELRGLFDLRDRWFIHGPGGDIGLVLLALWLFTQLNPGTVLFGNGHLRELVEASATELYAAETFVRIETAVTAANIVAIAALVALLANTGQWVRLLVVAAIAAGLAIHAFALALLFRTQGALAWLTPGAMAGLALGLVVAMAVVALPRAWAAAACGLALMAATALVNLAPANPYVALSLAALPQGYFFNFNGLTRLVSALWPFATLAYLLAISARTRAGSA